MQDSDVALRDPATSAPAGGEVFQGPQPAASVVMSPIEAPPPQSGAQGAAPSQAAPTDAGASARGASVAAPSTAAARPGETGTAAPEPLVPVPLRLLLKLATQAEEAGRVEEAEQLAVHMLKAAPHEPDVLQLAAIVSFRRQKHAQAITLLEQAIRRSPRNALYLRNISEMYRVVGRLDDALTAARQAVALRPGDPIALHNQSIVHQERGEPEGVLACARRALAIKPDMPGPHFALAEAQLLLGEFAEGWEEYEWRFRLPGIPPMMPEAMKQGRRQWGGAPLGEATLLLVGDQGFGDVIQFSRYIPWVLARAPRTALAASIEMAPLMRRLFPELHVFTHWAEAPAFAVYCPLSGLPRLHGTRPDTIPPPAPFGADPARISVWQERLDRAIPAGLRRIGIAWAGRPTHRNDRNRTLSFDRLAPLGDRPGIALVSLQKGEAAEQLKTYSGRAPLVDAGAEAIDFEDTAAVIAGLDLVITVDTSVAHLAAAMGRPIWIMLPFAPDWRWLRERRDSPWYPSLRLFRQPRPRDWDSVLAEVSAALG